MNEASTGKSTVKIAGFGGQGVVLASIILGRAALLDGKYSTQTASYGSESRGGECKSEVVISRDKIDYPLVDKVQTLVVMSQPALSKYIDDLLPGGTLIVDPDMVQSIPDRENVKIVNVPASKAAENLGRTIVANIVMLGAFQKQTQIVSEKSLREAIREHVPPKTMDLNMKAFEIGMKLIRE